MYVRYVPLRCFGQHTNSTPENSDIPQGNNIAKLLRFIFLSLHVSAAVAFHLKRKIAGLCSQFLFLSANYEFAFQRIALYIPVCKILFDIDGFSRILRLQKSTECTCAKMYKISKIEAPIDNIR